jgi:hypothetical protein
MGKDIVSQEIIEQRIFLIRGQRVMLSIDLAKLYAVEVKVLIQAVKRNIARFPADFMFQITRQEIANLRSQITTSSSYLYRGEGVTDSRSQFVTLKDRGKNIKYLPYAFTEQGVAMLSSVLNSERAIQVNIAIIRFFVKLREMFSYHQELRLKLDQLESKIEKHDAEIRAIFEAIRQLMAPIPEKPKGKVGFHP